MSETGIEVIWDGDHLISHGAMSCSCGATMKCSGDQDKVVKQMLAFHRQHEAHSFRLPMSDFPKPLPSGNYEIRTFSTENIAH